MYTQLHTSHTHTIQQMLPNRQTDRQTDTDRLIDINQLTDQQTHTPTNRKLLINRHIQSLTNRHIHTHVQSLTNKDRYVYRLRYTYTNAWLDI